jgi:aspartyl-tRNA(Asn)/glutamyl-tRNA(Gln) amidotransferase subunit A
MARTVEDIAWLLNSLTNAAERGEDYTRYLNKDVRGLRVGLAIHALKDTDPGVLSAFQNSVAALQALGVEVIETDVPSDQEFHLAVSMGLILSRCEAAAYHRAFEGQASLYTRPVREQLEEANQVTAVTYLQAQRYRAAFQQRILDHLKDYDALLMPTSRVPAPKTTEVENFFLTLSLNCIPWSFIGFPAISLPCGLTPDQLPVGAQLVAGPFEDGRLLALAAALEAKLKETQ